MRVAHVAPRFPPAEGGGERHVASLAAALARRGLAVHVATTKLRTEVPLRLDPALPDREVAGGAAVARLPVVPTGLPVWGHGFRVPGLLQHLRALAPDVVHLHGYGYLAWDLLARARPRPWKLVLTSHGFLPGRGPWRVPKLLYDATRGRGTVRALDAAIAIAPPDAAVFERLGARRVAIVPNGVEAARFAAARADPAVLGPLGLGPGGYVLGVARLERLKGQDLLLEAFASLDPAFAGLRLVLAGEGTRAAALRAHAERLGLGGRVLLPGRVDDAALAALVKGARAFAHTPRDEPFGIAVLEAMAAGVPVLATEVGGLPYAAGGAAHLVAPEPGAIAAGLARVLADEALRSRLAAAGERRAAQLTWEANAAQVEGLYRSLF